jgi:putative transposase
LRVDKIDHGKKELPMAQETKQETPETLAAEHAEPERNSAHAAPAQKKRAARPTTRKPEESKSSSSGFKRLTPEDRLEMQKAIEAQVAGGVTVKDAVKNAGISDQTYYRWKGAAAPADEHAKSKRQTTVSAVDELAEFSQLDEENRRLRQLLAERLRAENVELRRRLGLD